MEKRARWLIAGLALCGCLCAAGEAEAQVMGGSMGSHDDWVGFGHGVVIFLDLVSLAPDIASIVMLGRGPGIGPKRKLIGQIGLVYGVLLQTIGWIYFAAYLPDWYYSAPTFALGTLCAGLAIGVLANRYVSGWTPPAIGSASVRPLLVRGVDGGVFPGVGVAGQF